ncbi:ABC-type taurine transport system, periplasmic component [Kingella potus]|uniref:ABC-type taurine transport system, periplasmic component n=1 Tax=Kingella potus TaxID=265175 RepID=A0A377QYK8_9NEIS|nr:ABC transporter substrate-binding protein [Kingella potus]UOP01623.1 ABC transporter substrate-binding protein [Kingella potus]STR00082.1 ABC-type taurine transport system, periplasmic component [Kingella potus]
MELKRREFLQLAAALAAAGASPALWAAGREPFTVYGAPALPSMMIAVAALQGKLAKQADVSLKIWRSPDQLRAGVASGQFKIMMSPSNVGANLRNQGRKVGMVNILTNGITQIVCKQNIAAPQDLAGKKIIVPFKNDMPDIVLQALLKKLKIDAGKVAVTYAATPVEAVGLFLGKDFHAAVLPEPMASACILRGKAMGANIMRGFDLVKAWGQAFDTKPLIPMAGIIADTDYFRAHKAQFDTFHQDLKNALVWINANRQSAAQIGKNYLPAPEPALAAGLDGARLTVTKASEIKNEILHFYEILMQFNPKLLGGKMPDSGFFLS